MLWHHGGDIYRNQVKYDFSTNINPYGMPRAARYAALEGVEQSGSYPDGWYEKLREAIGEHEQVDAAQVLVGNGAAELIYGICHSIQPKRVLIPAPAFSEYAEAAAAVGAQVIYHLAKEPEYTFTFDEQWEAKVKEADLVFFCNPCNPTGTLVERIILEKIAKCCEEAGTYFCIDECFLPLVEDADALGFVPLLENYPHVIVLRAFTKVYGMPGLRLGYGVSANQDLLEAVRTHLPPWNVSLPAQLAGKKALLEKEYLKESLQYIQEERARLYQALRYYQNCGKIQNLIMPTANYLFFSVASAEPDFGKQMLENGILVRDCSNYYGLKKGDYRICVNTKEANTYLLEVLEKLWGVKEAAPSREVPRKRAKAIMIQGTMSSAGKSLLVAGLCRIFKEDGYRVAPFKSQNMALNSFITEENLEMGRAQVVQAEAAGVSPSVRMNPILLKPTTDMGSQVIVLGKAIGTMKAAEYFKKKREYLPIIREAYESLAEEYEIIVIEGAGSPAEINLKKDDIVNMGMAKIADAPVLLVGDIDRGGVFAQLCGTVQLLDKEEQERIQGLIVNKFRGDKTILEPGITMLEEQSGKDVLGVVPYMNIKLEEEDSLAEELSNTKRPSCEQALQENLLDLAVIRLPKISNFTDFQSLSLEPGVSLRYVTNIEELGTPDAVILPGTKSTMEDLRWLRASGLEAVLLKRNQKGMPILGICGGYQMLGEKLQDAEGAEHKGMMEGMKLLPGTTEFAMEKTTRQVCGTLPALEGLFAPLSGCAYKGYEIHHGHGDLVCAKELVFGTYIHGIFDEEELRKMLVQLLRRQAGKPEIFFAERTKSYEAWKEEQYAQLAAELRASLDMEKIYAILWNWNARKSKVKDDAVLALNSAFVPVEKPEDIEKNSFAIITKELGDVRLDPMEAPILKRVIHTSADFDYLQNLYFSPGVVPHLLNAIKDGACIVTDTQMAKSGINKKELAKYGGEVYCFMSDEEVAQEAKLQGTTRAVASMNKAAKLKGKLIFAIGNAPTALLQLHELRKEGLHPEGIVAVPVGFVNVVEAKELIVADDVPSIVARGRKGGSNVAAAIINALLYMLRES